MFFILYSADISKRKMITMGTYFSRHNRASYRTCPLVIAASMLHFFVTATKKLPLRASNIRQTIFCGQFGRSVRRRRRRRYEDETRGNDSWLAGKLQSPDALSSTPLLEGMGDIIPLRVPIVSRSSSMVRASLPLTTPPFSFLPGREPAALFLNGEKRVGGPFDESVPNCVRHT